jgi:hypothetical protein
MSVSAQVEVVIKAIDEASQEFRKIGDAVEETGSKFSTLKDIAKTAAGVLLGELAHDALGALTKSLDQASRNFVDLELTLTQITASMGKTGDEAKALRDEFQKVVSQQTDLGYSAVEAAEALESLVKAGLKGEEAVKALRASLEMARIENIDTARASEMLTTVMNQFKLSADDASRVVDVLVNASAVGRGTASDFAEGLKYVGTMANMMGLTLEETTATLVALNNAGLDATSAGRYLAGMLSDLIEKGQGIIPTWDNFNNLIREGKISMEDTIAVFDKLMPELGLSKLATEDLELAWHGLTSAVEDGKISQDQIAQALKKSGFEVNKLGFEIYNADGNMKSLNEIVMLLTDKLNSFGSQAERDAYLNEMFGEQSRRAATILVQMGGELSNVTDRLSETGTAGEMVNEIMDTTAGRMAKTNAESQNASLGFGGLTAKVKEAFAGFTNLLGPLGSTAQALGPSVLQGAVAGLTSMLPSLIASVGGVSGAFSAMGGLISTSIIPLLTNPLTLAILGIVTAIGVLYMAWQNNWGGIRDILGGAVSYIQNALSGAFKWLQENWTILFGPVGLIYSMWKNNWLGIRDFTDGIIKSLQNIFSGGFKGIVDSISGFLKSASDTISGWAKGISDWWSGFIKSLTGSIPKTPTEIPKAPPAGYGMAGGEFPKPTEIAPTTTPTTVVEVTSPLVVVEGSADEKTAERAAEKVKETLKTVVIEATSGGAPTKAVRVMA